MDNTCDPYCIVTCLDESHRTRTILKCNTHRQPHWDERIAIDVPSAESFTEAKVKIDLYDAEQFGADNFIASVSQKVTDIEHEEGGALIQWFPLVNKDDEKVGEIKLEFHVQ